jgi:hypothetical protein
MISWSAFEAALVDWLVPAYVPRVIFANQRAPQPAMPYASLLLMASAKEGGRDPSVLTQDLTRAKSVRLTPTVANGATYTVTIDGHAYTYVSGGTTLSAQVAIGALHANEDYTITIDGHAVTVNSGASPDATNILKLGFEPLLVALGYNAGWDGSNLLINHGATPFAITVSANLALTGGADPVTAAQITAGFKAAMSAATQTVTDNHGTLDITGTAVFALVVTTNLAWVNLDAGHELVTTITGQRRLSYQITVHVDEANAVAGGAYAWAESIRTSLSLPSVIDSLWQAGIAVVKDTGARDMSAVVNGQWVQRAQVDVVLRAAVDLAEDTGYIASATATGTIDEDLPDEMTVVVRIADPPPGSN